MANPIDNNNNGEHPSNKIEEGKVAANSTEANPFISSMKTMSSTAQEGVVFYPSITQSFHVTPMPIMESNFRPFATNFIMLVPGREQPFGMPTSLMVGLNTNVFTFVDNAVTAYSLLLQSGSAIGNPSRTMQLKLVMGLGFQAMLTFTINSMMSMRQQMEKVTMIWLTCLPGKWVIYLTR